AGHPLSGSGDIRFDNHGGRRHAGSNLPASRNLRCIDTHAEGLLFSLTQGDSMTRQTYVHFAAAAFLLFSLGFIPISAASLEPVVTEGIVNAPADAVWKAFTVSSVIEQWMVAK